MQTVAALYRNDKLLGPALAEGLKGQTFADQVMNDGQRMNQPRCLRGAWACRVVEEP